MQPKMFGDIKIWICLQKVKSEDKEMISHEQELDELVYKM